MGLDVVRLRALLAEECALATAHYILRPSEQSRAEALMILDGIYHGVYVLVQACQGEWGRQALEMAREITAAEQCHLRSGKGGHKGTGIKESAAKPAFSSPDGG